MNMSDGIENNNFHPSDSNVSDPPPGVNRSFVGQKPQHIHQQQQQQQQSGRYPKGGVVDHHQATQQHMSPMVMNDKRSPFPSSAPQQPYWHTTTNSEQFVLPTTFASISDNHYNNFHRQSNNFQPEKIQMLPRGQQDRGHQHQQKLTRSLPIMHHNNGGLLHGSCSRPFSQSLPQSQGSLSLEALRADIHRKTLELEQVEKQAGYSSSVPSSIIQPSHESLFPSSLQQLQQPRLLSKSLFHHEDPLGFCLADKANGHGERTSSNKKDPFAPVPVSLQQQQQQNPKQMTTISKGNLAQVSRRGALFTALPPPSPDSSQSKRRRLNSDQMLHMFLSDTIIESPSVVAGKKLLVPTATTTAADDSADRDSGMPSPPFSNDESMTSEGDEESTKLQVSDDKQSKHEAKEAAQKDVSEHIITPSTATISKLSAEIRSQALMKREKIEKERTTSPSNESQDSSFEPNQDRPITNITAARLAKIASAMEASQTSQQNIHDWDKKFGLKRAHSKTMRESCRSRKKVLDFLKREIDEGKESVLSTLLEDCGAKATTSCSDVVTTRQEEERDQGSMSSSSSYSSGRNEDIMGMSDAEEEKDDLDVELERMFRRASMDCVGSILSVGSSLLERARQSSSGTSGSSDKSVADTLRSSMTMPLPEEEDRVQYNAKCA